LRVACAGGLGGGDVTRSDRLWGYLLRVAWAGGDVTRSDYLCGHSLAGGLLGGGRDQK